MFTYIHGSAILLVLLAGIAACGTESPAAAAAKATATTSGGLPGLVVASQQGGTTGDPQPIAPGGTGAATSTTGGAGAMGPPINAPAGQWSWVPFAASECADGSPTGIGVSPVTGSDRLVIFLQGGGRCDSAASCGNNGTAANLKGFTQANFNKFAAGATGIFNRKDASNPVAQANFVFVPYCTGDDHSGDNIASYGTHHRGYANMGLFLQRVVPTFPGVKEVLITGSSAGGSGAFWNYYRTQQAFGTTHVVLLDDAGPFLGEPYKEITPAAVKEWALAKTLPPGCQNCLPGPAPAGLQNIYKFFAQAMPGHRGALLTSTMDAHVAGRDNLSGAGFATALNALADSLGTVDPSFKVFYVPSQGHTWLGGVNGSLNNVTVAGTSLSTFLARELNGDPAWADVR